MWELIVLQYRLQTAAGVEEQINQIKGCTVFVLGSKVITVF